MLSITDLAQACIDDFDLQEKNYLPVQSELINTTGQGQVLVKDSPVGRVSVNFRQTNSCKVYVGSNFKGSVTIDFHGNSSIVYIGNNCVLNGVLIRSIYTGENTVYIGNNVTTTGKCTFFSGDGAGGGGKTKPALIVGDDCMFAWDVTVRNTDSHPIYRFSDESQINEPSIGAVVIEPHVWIGQGASILKDVRVGVCSIIGLGSVVTSDIPRFSSAKGVPAKYSNSSDIYWSRNASQSSRDRAKYYANRFDSKPTEAVEVKLNSPHP